jgi:hypothetical protein
MREWRYTPQLLISALDGGELSASRRGHFTPGEIAPGTHWIGGWAGRCREEKNLLLLPGIEPWSSSLQPITIPTELSRLLTGGQENAKADLGAVTNRNIRA